ncbi:MAG: YbjN domain-containing protein [Verrucomicrobiota bacterium]
MVKSKLYSTVTSVFQKEGWEYAEVSGNEVIRAGFEAHHTRVELHVQVFEPLNAIAVVAESSHSTDNPAQRERLAELVMRVNQTLTIGNFELDWDKGRLLFRAANLFSTAFGDPDIVRGLVHNTVGEMDRMAPFESMILSSSGAGLASLNLAEQLQRSDLLPEIPEPESK